MISKSSQEKILNRLQQENSRSPYLNSLAGRLQSYSKLDLSYLSAFNSDLLHEIVPSITSGGDFVYYHNPEKTSTTILDDFAVQKSIRTIIDKAKINLSETGSQTLNIGYPLLVQRSSTNQTDCKVIPLFIWSVNVVNEKLANRWRFTILKEQPQINYPFIGLINSENIPINYLPLYEDIINEEFQTFEFDSFKEKMVAWIKANEEIIQRFPESFDSLERMPFERKSEICESTINGISFELYNSATLTNYKESKYSIIKDLAHFDGEIPSLKTAEASLSELSAIHLDPSQFGVINDINDKNHIVLHGPPGTGKSQTITGIITSALSNGLKTAVVCQKASAMDVLIKNLNGLGITKEVIKITNVILDRKQVVEKVRSYKNEAIDWKLSEEVSPKTLNQFNSLAADVVNAQIITREKLLLEQLNWRESVGTLGKIKRIMPELSNYDFSCISDVWSKDENLYDSLASTLDLLLDEARHFGNLIDYINLSFNGENLYDDLARFEQEVTTLKELYPEELDRLRKLLFLEQSEKYESLNAKFQDFSNDYGVCKSLISNIEKGLIALPGLDLNGENIDWYVNQDLSAFIEVVRKALNDVEQILIQLTSLESSIEHQKYHSFSKIRRLFLFFNASYRDYVNNYNFLEAKCNTYGVDKSQPKLKEIVNIIESLKSDLDKLLEITSKFNDVLPKIYHSLSEDLQQLKRDLGKKSEFEYEDMTSFQHYVSYCKAFEMTNEAINSIRKGDRLFNIYFAEKVLANPAKGLEILELIKSKGLHIEGVLELYSKQEEFGSPIPLSKRGNISYQKEFKYALLEYRTKEFYLKNKNILPGTSFNGKIRKIGSELAAIQDQVKRVALFKGALRRQTSVKEILKRASSIDKAFPLKGKNKRSLRHIVQKYTNEFTELFPVVMMTPEVACNLFEDKREHFDLLIVDEASQVELHDILPVLYKAKTIVVAGDQHQMPPSNYFQKNLADIEEDEDDDQEVLIDVESLLEFCQANTLFKSRYLDFHYRSNHSGLIRFSNDAIYKRLVIKPTMEWQYSPFMFSRVFNGKWIGQRNEAEAQRVVSLLKDIQIINDSIPHVVVATLNATHRKEIQDAIANEVNDSNEFQSKMNLLERKGFNVKNLENLQGDECDMLIVSTGYGPNLDGRFYQLFGKLNGKYGYRLLNVLITRAKFKVILVTSIPKKFYSSYPDQLKSGKVERGLFYAYLAFVEAYSTKNTEELKKISDLLREYGVSSADQDITLPGSGLESPFEEEVYDFLLKHYSKEQITVQEAHVNTGFRIDMVLRPNGNKGPKIAIECDGAMFHSGWHNQTLDVHRQRLLAAAGYDFVRIWSTDWWKNQQLTEIAIIERIGEIVRAHEVVGLEEKSWLYFDDEDSMTEESEFDFDIEEIELLDDDEIIDIKPVVTNDCIVKLKTNIRETPEFTISIVPNQGRIKKVRKEISYLPFNSPLALALKGKQVGDSLDFGKYNYEVLEIE